jgi:hypothetical protein
MKTRNATSQSVIRDDIITNKSLKIINITFTYCEDLM